MCAGNALFSHTKVVSERKIVREMLCFTIKTAVGGCEGRCERAGAVAYARLCSAMGGYRRIGAPLGSGIVGRESHVMVSRWLWVRFAALCHGEVHSKNCKSHCNGGFGW